MTMMMTSTDFIVSAFYNMPTITTTIISSGSNWSIQSTRLHHNQHHPVATSTSSTTTKLYSTMKERSRTTATATTTTSSTKVSDLSKQMKDMQNQLAN
jgi:predicted solute-binding protein